MNLTTAFIAGGLTLFAVQNIQAQLITLEPDNYTNGAVLNMVLPQVRLVTAGANNAPIPFDVTSRTTSPGYASTGERVFAHVGVDFFNNDRRLRMDFTSPVTSVAIDFVGGSSILSERGTLQVFSSANILLQTYRTGLLPPRAAETMVINRPTADIGYALAYTALGDGSFGVLDHLVFGTPVPEPSTFALVGIGVGLFLVLKGRGRNVKGLKGLKGLKS